VCSARHKGAAGSWRTSARFLAARLTNRLQKVLWRGARVPAMVDEGLAQSAAEDVEVQYDQKEPPQFGQFHFEGHCPRPNQTGPQVVLRNTFLDVLDDGDGPPPIPGGLARAQSTPAGYPAIGALLPPGSLEEDSDTGFGDPAVPPLPQELCRDKTHDPLDSNQEWSWEGVAAPNTGMVLHMEDPVATAPGQNAAATPSMVYNGQQVQMVMLPVEMVNAEGGGGAPVGWQTQQQQQQPQQPQQWQHWMQRKHRKQL